MSLFAGMSGWSYPGWRGAFYSPDQQPGGMLGSYAARFNTVEVNNTFYRMPTTSALAGWSEQVSATFQFAIKAPRAITRQKRLADNTDLVARFCDLLTTMGSRLGPVLFQFETRADTAQLADFLAIIRPRLRRIVMEFRHASWLTDETFELLHCNSVALCETETDDGCDPSIGAANFSYIRLRKSAYTAIELDERIGRLAALADGDHDVFCYLKHDVENAVLLRDLPGFVH
jgi:uncharacterized protein YecE (DUF72 family)